MRHVRSHFRKGLTLPFPAVAEADKASGDRALHFPGILNPGGFSYGSAGAPASQLTVLSGLVLAPTINRGDNKGHHTTGRWLTLNHRQISHFWLQFAVGLLAVCSVQTASAQVPSKSEDASIGQPKASRENLSPSDTTTSNTTTSNVVIDLRPRFKEWGLSIRAQGSRGTCSVFTITGAIEYALNKKQRRASRLSVEFLNWASNQAIGASGDGGFFSDLWRGFKRYGICDEKEMPYASDFDPKRQPSNAALDQARQCREAGLRLHWIKPWDPNRGLNDEQFAALKETLRQQWPVCGGFLWPKQAKWTDGVLQMATRDHVRDGHSVLLVGFRDDLAQPGGGVFLVQNSSNGPRNGALSYEYVRAYMNDAVWIGYDENRSFPESNHDSLHDMILDE